MLALDSATPPRSFTWDGDAPRILGPGSQTQRDNRVSTLADVSLGYINLQSTSALHSTSLSKAHGAVISQSVHIHEGRTGLLRSQRTRVGLTSNQLPSTRVANFTKGPINRVAPTAFALCRTIYFSLRRSSAWVPSRGFHPPPGPLLQRPPIVLTPVTTTPHGSSTSSCPTPTRALSSNECTLSVGFTSVTLF